MKHDRINRVAARQHHHRLRDAFVATLGAGILAFQIIAFSVSLGGQSDAAIAAERPSARIIAERADERDVCTSPDADDRQIDETSRGAADDKNRHCS